MTRTATMLRSFGDRLLEKVAPKAEAKAGGCYLNYICTQYVAAVQTCCQTRTGERCGTPSTCYSCCGIRR
ncbi:hypothetical protein Nm8I071_23460 [Nonomuraea sp. TT08I-71]|nr:hypothetical protein Nm8I071_23460 [Nonomuraea sp. TT08I-71]